MLRKTIAKRPLNVKIDESYPGLPVTPKWNIVVIMENATTLKAQKKKALPPPGRKLTAKQARALANKQFAKALAMLAK